MAELNRRIVAAVAATIVAAGLAACGGGGDGDEVQGKLGGKAVATDGQRVKVIKMLEDVTDPYALSVQGEVCGKNTTAGRFFVEVNRRRTISPLPGAGETIDLTPDCFSGWSKYVIPTSSKPTAIIYSPDANNPADNKVRFSVPKSADVPALSVPRTLSAPSTTTTTTTAPPPPTNPPTMSLAEFNAIQNGWSLQQVIDTVGGPGQLQSTSDFDGQHLEGYKWNGQSTLGFASASVFFRNGQVYEKLQFNLQ